MGASDLQVGPGVDRGIRVYRRVSLHTRLRDAGLQRHFHLHRPGGVLGLVNRDFEFHCRLSDDLSTGLQGGRPRQGGGGDR
ncbi:hypothetical protein D3C73_1004830 [compost metagenome]